jgi:hypothetical protein
VSDSDSDRLDRPASRRMPPKQKSRHVALSAITMLCFGVRRSPLLLLLLLSSCSAAVLCCAVLCLLPSLPPCCAMRCGLHCCAGSHCSLTTSMCASQAAVLIFKYHSQPGGQLYGVSGLGTAAAGVAAGGAAMPVSASGSGVVMDGTLSPSEVSQLLTPGIMGHGPFDLPKYPGFCRKMRVGLGGLGCRRTRCYCAAARFPAVPLLPGCAPNVAAGALTLAIWFPHRHLRLRHVCD